MSPGSPTFNRPAGRRTRRTTASGRTRRRRAGTITISSCSAPSPSALLEEERTHERRLLAALVPSAPPQRRAKTKEGVGHAQTYTPSHHSNGHRSRHSAENEGSAVARPTAATSATGRTRIVTDSPTSSPSSKTRAARKGPRSPSKSNTTPLLSKEEALSMFAHASATLSGTAPQLHKRSRHAKHGVASQPSVILDHDQGSSVSSPRKKSKRKKSHRRQKGKRHGQASAVVGPLDETHNGSPIARSIYAAMNGTNNNSGGDDDDDDENSLPAVLSAASPHQQEQSCVQPAMEGKEKGAKAKKEENGEEKGFLAELHARGNQGEDDCQHSAKEAPALPESPQPDQTVQHSRHIRVSQRPQGQDSQSRSLSNQQQQPYGPGSAENEDNAALSGDDIALGTPPLFSQPSQHITETPLSHPSQPYLRPQPSTESGSVDDEHQAPSTPGQPPTVDPEVVQTPIRNDAHLLPQAVQVDEAKVQSSPSFKAAKTRPREQNIPLRFLASTNTSDNPSTPCTSVQAALTPIGTLQHPSFIQNCDIIEDPAGRTVVMSWSAHEVVVWIFSPLTQPSPSTSSSTPRAHPPRFFLKYTHDDPREKIIDVFGITPEIAVLTFATTPPMVCNLKLGELLPFQPSHRRHHPQPVSTQEDADVPQQQPEYHYLTKRLSPTAFCVLEQHRLSGTVRGHIFSITVPLPVVSSHHEACASMASRNEPANPASTVGTTSTASDSAPLRASATAPQPPHGRHEEHVSSNPQRQGHTQGSGTQNAQSYPFVDVRGVRDRKRRTREKERQEAQQRRSTFSEATTEEIEDSDREDSTQDEDLDTVCEALPKGLDSQHPSNARTASANSRISGAADGEAVVVDSPTVKVTITVALQQITASKKLSTISTAHNHDDDDDSDGANIVQSGSTAASLILASYDAVAFVWDVETGTSLGRLYWTPEFVMPTAASQHTHLASAEMRRCLDSVHFATLVGGIVRRRMHQSMQHRSDGEPSLDSFTTLSKAKAPSPLISHPFSLRCIVKLKSHAEKAEDSALFDNDTSSDEHEEQQGHASVNSYLPRFMLIDVAFQATPTGSTNNPLSAAFASVPAANVDQWRPDTSSVPQFVQAHAWGDAVHVQHDTTSSQQPPAISKSNFCFAGSSLYLVDEGCGYLHVLDCFQRAAPLSVALSMQPQGQCMHLVRVVTSGGHSLLAFKTANNRDIFLISLHIPQAPPPSPYSSALPPPEAASE